MTLFLTEVSSVKVALDLFEEFYRYAGLRLNKNKTEAIVLYNDGNIYQDTSLGILWKSGNFKTLGAWFSPDITEIQTLNINDRLNKIESLLNVWNSRSLTLKGKVTIIKSLIMPHIIHIASFLFLSNNFINKIDKMLFNFLWSGKKPMISKATVIQNTGKGGINMISITEMIKAIKIMWIKRLNNHIDAKWKILSWFFLPIEKNVLFSKLGYQNIRNKCVVPYYDQVIKIWFDFVCVSPRNKQEILEEQLFNNYNICINHKPINEIKGFEAAGIKTIKDITNPESNQIENLQALSNRLNAPIMPIQYYGLKAAIPKSWVKKLHNDKIQNFPETAHSKCLNNIMKINNKMIYKTLIEDSVNIPSSQNKWIENYPFLESAPWSIIYKIPFETITDSFIQSMQYKIIHRIFNCNYNLHKWKIKSNPKCNFCDHIDTIEHFLFYCESCTNFWHTIEKWIHTSLGTRVHFTVLEIVFGYTQKTQLTHILNYIIIMGKMHIKLQKKVEKTPCFLIFLNYLKTNLNIEKLIYIKNDKINLYNTYFELLDEIL